MCVRADVSWKRDELRGHKLRDRGTHCNYSMMMVIWHTQRNLNEKVGEKDTGQHTRLFAVKHTE